VLSSSVASEVAEELLYNGAVARVLGMKLRAIRGSGNDPKASLLGQ